MVYLIFLLKIYNSQFYVPMEVQEKKYGDA